MTTTERIQAEPRTDTLRAAIYVRVSTMRQGAEGTSLETQEEHCRAYALHHGYSVGDGYVFQDVHSGGDLFERPGLRRLREAIGRGEVQVIISYALDRLTRDQTHLGVLVNLIEEAGARLEFVTERFDDTPVGKFIRNAQAFAAEMERVKGQERTDRARHARIAKGLPLVGPRPPYGYQWNKDKTALELNLVTAPIVRRIYDEILAGSSLRAVAEGLRRDGIPTPMGKGLWVYTTVTAILQNPTYAGHYAAMRFQHEKRKEGEGKKTAKRQIKRPEAETVPLPGIAPAIISAEEFATVRERLEYNRRWIRRRPSDPEAALLRGPFIRCGYCGIALTAVRPKPGVYDYRCGSHTKYRGSERACSGYTIRAHLLDAAIWACVQEVLQHPTIIADRLEAMLAQPPPGADLEAIDSQLADLDRRQRNFLRAISALDDAEAAAPLAAEVAAVGRHRVKLLAERQEILRQREEWEAARGRLRSLVEWCQQVADRIPTLDYENKRNALTWLNVGVKVYGSDHDPRWEMWMQVGPRDEDELYATSGEDIEQIRQRMASFVCTGPTRSTCKPPAPWIPATRPSPYCTA
jgi:site-specific DNA recombinase